MYNFAHFEPSNCPNISLQWNFGRQNIFLSIFQLYKCFYNTWSLWDFFGQLILSKVWQKTHLVTRGWNKTRQWEIDIWVRGSFTPFVLQLPSFSSQSFMLAHSKLKKIIFLHGNYLKHPTLNLSNIFLMWYPQVKRHLFNHLLWSVFQSS